MRIQPFALLLPLLLAACSSAGLPTGPSPTPAGPAGPVSFTVKASSQAFSDKQPIKLMVWDAEQLAIADKTANCSVSMSADGKESTSCPPGVTYQKPTPEELTITKAQLDAGFKFTSKTVTTGERYRVSVGGRASDDCNSAGGSQEGVAGSADLILEIKDIAQTMMACVSPDQVPGSGGSAAAFMLTIDRTKFSDKRQITISVQDSLEGGGPEETIVSYADLAKPVALNARDVAVGEAYTITVSGLAADGCNSASGTAQGTAATQTVAVAITEVAQTKMACLPTK